MQETATINSNLIPPGTVETIPTPPCTVNVRILCWKYQMGAIDAFKVLMRIFLVFQLMLIIAGVVGQMQDFNVRIDTNFGTWSAFIYLSITFLWGLYLLLRAPPNPSFSAGVITSAKCYSWIMIVASTVVLVLFMFYLGLVLLVATLGGWITGKNPEGSDILKVVLTIGVWMIPFGLIPMIHATNILNAVKGFTPKRNFQPGFPPNQAANVPQQQYGYAPQPGYAPQGGYAAQNSA
jgi:hypothetical protein